MIKQRYSKFKYLAAAAWIALSSMLAIGCASTNKSEGGHNHDSSLLLLEKELSDIISRSDGTIGVAVITDQGDTIAINDSIHYPLMSVFKLHQALALAHQLDMDGISTDTIIHIERNELNPDTWSPMLKDHTEESFDMPLTKLMEYMLQQSDNNVSNLLFRRFLSVEATDTFIRKNLPVKEFCLSHTEAEMQTDHSLCQSNWSSPLACAILMDRIFTDSIVSETKQTEIKEFIFNTSTGTDRLKAAFTGESGIKLFHKTGSGYRDEGGRLMAHNDIGYVELPSGKRYSIAVLVTGFNGTEQEASNVIAEISKKVRDHIDIEKEHK